MIRRKIRVGKEAHEQVKVSLGLTQLFICSIQIRVPLRTLMLKIQRQRVDGKAEVRAATAGRSPDIPFWKPGSRILPRGKYDLFSRVEFSS